MPRGSVFAVDSFASVAQLLTLDSGASMTPEQAALQIMQQKKPDDKCSKQSFAQALSFGIALGAGVGAALGVAMHSLAIGIALGAGVGVAFASAFGGGRCKKDGD